MIICCLLFTLNAAAQGHETTDSISTQESKPNLLVRLHQLQQYLDTKAKAKVDSHYIEVPEKPWRVILRYKENVVDVDYYQSVDIPATNEHSDWNLCFEPPVASSVGFWVGYRGTGFSYSKSLTKNAGRTTGNEINTNLFCISHTYLYLCSKFVEARPAHCLKGTNRQSQAPNLLTNGKSS